MNDSLTGLDGALGKVHDRGSHAEVTPYTVERCF